MAQRHEIEAWVNPDAWDDPEHAERVIDAIEASGSDSEAEWVRIASGDLAPTDAARVILEAAARDDSAAQERADTVRAELRRAALDALDAGMSEHETARVAGVTRMTIRAWRRA